jgi:LysR family transcriptional regulator, transcriptional activator of the cysJI operon
MQMGTIGVFCDVAQTESFTKAAKKNGRSTASVSLLFHALEDELGVRLAARNTAHFKLTPEGEVCRDYCREILQLNCEALRRVAEEHEKSDKTFKLAACRSFGFHQLQSILRCFRQSYPDFTINHCYAHIDQVHDLVLNGPIDLGLTAYPRHLRGLVIEHIRRERLVLICHRQHRLAARADVPLAALRGLPVIAWREIPWSAFLKKVPDSQRHMFEPHCLFDELEMVKEAVKRDVGIAMLPEAAVAAEVAAHELAAVPFENGRYAKPVAVIRRKGRVPNTAMLRFIEFLKQPGECVGNKSP